MAPILIRQNSSERLSAGFVFESAKFSDPDTLLIRTRFGGSFSLPPQISHVQMTEALQTSSACHSNGTSAVGTQVNVHVVSASRELSLDGCVWLHSWLLWLRCAQLEQSPTVFVHRRCLSHQSERAAIGSANHSLRAKTLLVCDRRISLQKRQSISDSCPQLASRFGVSRCYLLHHLRRHRYVPKPELPQGALIMPC